jgi:hypothetical protein
MFDCVGILPTGYGKCLTQLGRRHLKPIIIHSRLFFRPLPERTEMMRLRFIQCTRACLQGLSSAPERVFKVYPVHQSVSSRFIQWIRACLQGLSSAPECVFKTSHYFRAGSTSLVVRIRNSLSLYCGVYSGLLSRITLQRCRIDVLRKFNLIPTLRQMFVSFRL